MAMRNRLPLFFFLLLVCAAILASGKQDPELRQCKQQCKRFDQSERQRCEERCEEYHRGRGGSESLNPQDPEERLRECERQCESRQQQEKPRCRRRCEDECRREQEEGGRGRGEGNRRDPQQEYEECRRGCRREGEGREQQQRCEQRCEEQRQEREREREVNRRDPQQEYEECRRECRRETEGRQRCEQRCEEQRQQRERERERGEGNPRYEGSEEEEEERGERGDNPYVFEEHHFSTRYRSEHGRIRVLPKFTERSRILRGIENYRVEIFEADPQTFMLPKHCDAEAIFFVAKGRGTISLVCRDGKETFNLRRGDVLRVPSGATAYLVNQDNNEKLIIAKLIQTVSTPGHYESFFGAGGEEPESYYKAFNEEVLEAAFNTNRERLRRLFGQQRKGIIVRASQEQIRALSRGEEGGHWPFGGGESRGKGPINLFDKHPKHSNNYGRLHEVDENDYRQLQDLDVAVGFANISQGAMETPFYNTRATKIVLVVRGEGCFEMACPHLASEEYGGRQEGQRGRRGQQGEGQGSPRYQRVSARLRQGVLFVVPVGHPAVAVASDNQNLEMVSWEINARNNEKVPLAGRKNIMNHLEKEAKELAFGAPAREVDEIFRSQQEDYFFKGPRKQREGLADA